MPTYQCCVSAKNLSSYGFLVLILDFETFSPVIPIYVNTDLISASPSSGPGTTMMAAALLLTPSFSLTATSIRGVSSRRHY